MRTEQRGVAAAQCFHKCCAFVEMLGHEVGSIPVGGVVSLFDSCLHLKHCTSAVCLTFLSKRRTMVASSSRVLYQAMNEAASTLSSGGGGDSTILFCSRGIPHHQCGVAMAVWM